MAKIGGIEQQIATFAARYTPEIAAATRKSRAKMRAMFARGHELVYDNYNALVFGYSPSASASDAVASIAAYPRWVTLFLLNGAGLDDPLLRLKGSGKRVRSVTLGGPSDLDSPAIRALIDQVIAARAREFRDAPKLTTVVRSVSARRRPRRPAVTKRSAKRARRNARAC